MGRRRGRTPTPIAIKVYVVLQRINLTRGDEPNSRVIAVRLTRSGADEVRDGNPGTWVERHVAVKEQPAAPKGAFDDQGTFP